MNLPYAVPWTVLVLSHRVDTGEVYIRLGWASSLQSERELFNLDELDIDTWIDQVLNGPLDDITKRMQRVKLVQLSQPSLSEIDTLWEQLHSVRVEKGVEVGWRKPLAYYEGLILSVELATHAEFEGSKEMRMIRENTESLDGVLNCLICRAHNCTFIEQRDPNVCPPVLYFRLMRSSELEYSLQGFMSGALKYCVIGRDPHRFRAERQSILSLIYGFRGEVWLTFALSSILTGILISYTSKKFAQTTSDRFSWTVGWLYSTSLEQRDDGGNTRNWKNWQLLIGWLYLTILVRNLYTSNLYSDITKKLPPSNLPLNITATMYY